MSLQIVEYSSDLYTGLYKLLKEKITPKGYLI